MITKHPHDVPHQKRGRKDGRVVARACEVFWNGGAYADIGPRVAQKSGFTAAGPYDIDNVSIDSFALYTNRTPAGALRGFGVPQLVWAYESHTDLSRASSASIRSLSAAQHPARGPAAGERHARFKTPPLPRSWTRSPRASTWDKPFDRGRGTLRRGRGIAIGFKASISPTTSVAIVNVSADGSTDAYCSTVDMGQGSGTAFAQMVGEVLDLKAEDVRVVHPDTDMTPYDMGTLGSRSLSTWAMPYGSPPKMRAPNCARLPPKRDCRKARIIAARRDLQETLRHAGRQCDRHRELHPELQVARCADRAVGQCHAVLDGRRRRRRSRGRHRDRPCAVLGSSMSPIAARRSIPAWPQTQIVGRRDHAARLHAVGSDASRWRPGHQCLARRLQDPRHRRYSADGERAGDGRAAFSGPFGAKGVGESGTFGVSPAIANAIHDAVGVRITELPITAEAVLRALRAKDGRPLEGD